MADSTLRKYIWLINTILDAEQEDMFYENGYRFFKQCDFHYIFREGEVTQYFDRAKVL